MPLFLSISFMLVFNNHAVNCFPALLKGKQAPISGSNFMVVKSGSNVLSRCHQKESRIPFFSVILGRVYSTGGDVISAIHGQVSGLQFLVLSFPTFSSNQVAR